MTTRIERYTDVAAYARSAPIHLVPNETSRAWSLGVSTSRAVTLACDGDPSLVAAYDAALLDLDTSQGEDARMRTIASLAGSSVNVPAYLSGSPMCMRRRKRVSGNARHVTIYVSLGASAGVSAESMADRGQTVLALLASLQAINVSVDVKLVLEGDTDKGDLFHVIDVECRPLDLSVSGFAIAHPAFTRHVGYSSMQAHGFKGGWSTVWGDLHRYPSRPSEQSTSEYSKRVARILGASETDVFIAPMYLTDPLSTNPKRWIQDRLNQVTQSEASQ